MAEIEREQFTGGSAFQKLLNRFSSGNESIDLETATQVRQADVDLDLTLNDLTDGWNNGSLFRREQDYLAAVASATRSAQATKNAVLLEEAQRKSELQTSVQKVQRFFALPDTEVEATVPRDSSFRMKIIRDPNNPTSFRQVVDPSLDTPEARAKEIASFFDIPEEAVLAKREQEVSIAAKIAAKEEEAGRRVRAEQRAEAGEARAASSELRAASKEFRAQERFDAQQRTRTSVLGYRQEALKRTKDLPESELRDILQDPSISDEDKGYVETALEHRDHLESYRDIQDQRALQATEAQRYFKDIQAEYDKSPALVDEKFLKKDGTLDHVRVLNEANMRAKAIVIQNQLELKRFDLLNAEHDFGPGGTFTEDLDGPEKATRGLPRETKIGALLGGTPTEITDEEVAPLREGPDSPLARLIRGEQRAAPSSDEAAREALARFREKQAESAPRSPLVAQFRDLQRRRAIQGR